MNRREFVDGLAGRVMVLDGAVGTMLWPERRSATVDELVLSKPDIVLALHKSYVSAGADILTTNTMNASRASLAAYGECLDVVKINECGVALARMASQSAGRPIFVAGSMGTGLEVADDDTLRKSLHDSLREQAECLIRAGVDALLIETVFSLANAETTAMAVKMALNAVCSDAAVVMSVTVGTDGCTMTGDTPGQIYDAVSRHVRLSAFGLNCGSDIQVMLRCIEELQDLPVGLMLYPNAGLPDSDGCYGIAPSDLALALRPLIEGGKLNIVGGCCGTTPDHIAALAAVARTALARQMPAV